jgi:hypothetical protein
MHHAITVIAASIDGDPLPLIVTRFVASRNWLPFQFCGEYISSRNHLPPPSSPWIRGSQQGHAVAPAPFQEVRSRPAERCHIPNAGEQTQLNSLAAPIGRSVEEVPFQHPPESLTGIRRNALALRLSHGDTYPIPNYRPLWGILSAYSGCD